MRCISFLAAARELMSEPDSGLLDRIDCTVIIMLLCGCMKKKGLIIISR